MSKDTELRSMIEAGFAQINRRLDGIDGRLVELEKGQAVVIARLDEQRQTINALIPQRIAAVGEKKAG